MTQSKETDAQAEAAPAKLFSSPPKEIVVWEMVPFDEPVYETVVDKLTNKTDGIPRMVGRNVGESLQCRSETAHIDGKTAYPVDGSPALQYGPGQAGCWGKHATSGK